MKKIKIAVIQFPGSNCEFETQKAIASCGMAVEIFRWNRDVKELTRFNGYVIGGGFSYQDRVRAGAIAAKEPIMEVIIKESEKGKPILGICNGAQILVESGLVPNIKKKYEIEIALSSNKMEKQGEIKRRDYYCKWVFLKHKLPLKKTAFSFCLNLNEVIPIPIAHAEGRFITKDKFIAKKLKDYVVFSYCNSDGEEKKEFPTNPNSSIYNAAGICNTLGNVLALMPHPERANWLKQIPLDLKSSLQQKRISAIGKFHILEKEGSGRLIFNSMKKYIQENYVI